MAKRTATPKPPTASPTASAGAGWQANAGSLQLAAWASRLGGAPPHSQEAGRKSIGGLEQAKADPTDPSMRPGWKRPRPPTPPTDPSMRTPGTDASTGAPLSGNPAPFTREWLARGIVSGLHHLRGDAPSVGQAGKGHAPALSPQQSRAFETANAHFEQSHMQGHAPDQSQGAPRKGWGPAARIASAKARNAKTLPYNGDPTQAPDYVEPKGKGGK
jgi:hypothetical protein